MKNKRDFRVAVTRRDFLRAGTAAGVGASIGGSIPASAAAAPPQSSSHGPDMFNEATIAQLQAAMASGRTTSVELTNFYLNRIRSIDEKQNGPGLNSIALTRTRQRGSWTIAASMLNEVRRWDQPHKEEERVVTKREEEVLQLIADGCSTPEVAEKLYISQKTVKNHLASIYQKLDARDRTQAVLQAVRMGIVHLQ